jgi:hypothetical protein
MPDDAGGHIDTNCLFIARGAFVLLDFWERYPRPLSATAYSCVRCTRAVSWPRAAAR